MRVLTYKFITFAGIIAFAFGIVFLLNKICTPTKITAAEALEQAVGVSHIDTEKSVFALSDYFYEKLNGFEKKLENIRTIDELFYLMNEIKLAVEKSGGNHYRLLNSSVMVEIKRRVNNKNIEMVVKKLHMHEEIVNKNLDARGQTAVYAILDQYEN